jgi:hypothetical protein
MYPQPQPIPPDIQPLLTVGVVADTHIPDRVGTLHPELIPTLKAAGVGHILHAGDICVPGVLDELRQVAPVTAARGNRDILLASLPLVQNVTLEGVEIALMHGHGGLWFYLWDKWQFVFFGYKFKRYLWLLRHSSGTARVVVFGHTHRQENCWVDGKLLFNPGAAGMIYDDPFTPSIGLLRIYSGQQVEGEILPLNGYLVRGRQWVAKPK